MRIFAKIFFTNEDGAVTVDWVVLTAGLIALVLAAFALLEGGTNGLATSLGAEMAERDTF